MKRIMLLVLLFACTSQSFAQQSVLSVDKIMQDPDTWIGSSPYGPFWSDDGETLYFYWNPMGEFESDSLYSVQPGKDPVKVAENARRQMQIPSFFGSDESFSDNRRQRVYTFEGDIWLEDTRRHTKRQLTDTPGRESAPQFSSDEKSIYYTTNNNVFQLDLNGGISQLSDLQTGNEPSSREMNLSDREAYLEQQQLDLFSVFSERERSNKLRKAAREREDEATNNDPPAYYAGSKFYRGVQIDPNGRYVTFGLGSRSGADRTGVQDYVTTDGYATELTARPKVGSPTGKSWLYLQDLSGDTTLQIDFSTLEGIYDVPEYLAEQGVEVDSSKARPVDFSRIFWSTDGKHAAFAVRSQDHKDRWIVALNPETAALTILDRQHDEAWIGGPDISWAGPGNAMGWLPDNKTLWFKSEETGFSHIHTVDAESGTEKQLTSGSFEIFNPEISPDGRWFYFTSSEDSPFVRHFYRMAVTGGRRTKLTTMRGNNAVTISPDGQTMAIIQSESNRPAELFIQDIGSNEIQRVTHSTTTEWESYNWRETEIIHFEASDGVQVPAQIFKPKNPNGAAVIFVHGAGYLQNVHEWWSGYYREYMFNNMLCDLGYTVINVDYRASAGYGRDWRTAIYRYMGGRDLQDQVDASKYLQSEYDIEAERIFMYGGSYGGFITLMALFNEPQHFGAGAALRSVTDWAHYNHGYTSNILNTPQTDSLAYYRSSPINFAEGLEDPVLIPHGMIDTNVHFQDVVRLAQRLIELGKKDWEMAVFPLEGHGFVEPSSWTDEYRRIFELIEKTVGPNGSKAN